MSDKKRTIIRILNEFELNIGTVIFIAITILLTLQVLTRYVFGHAFSWSEEASTIGFIWLAYLGTSAAVLKGKHLRIDLFLNMMHGRLKKCVLVFTNLVTMFFCCYISVPLFRLVFRYYESGASTLLLEIPMYITYGMIPVCLLLTTVRLVQDTIRVIKSDPDEVKVSTAKTLFDVMEDEEKEEAEK